ncbi:tetratricopeptide repeat protein [Desulfobotulus sp. H1]|uniref:Tetratricopeptide repeat protein n=1 Tax=Desulfobotulus pelophilus TaxID=2823377 RepID=A0ABT3N4X8_9BACT|nr:tetratricopeptide repeat protein [Desulfobotulus pelophilus]MCW7752503.1 tetratricopeptide repeat protein [Desulfobotulus pelophilus]
MASEFRAGDVLEQVRQQLESGENEKALERLLVLEAERKGQSFFWQLLGIARLRMQDREGAAAAFAKGLERDDTDALLWRNLGWAFHGMERWADGREAFERALSFSGEGEDAYGMALCLYGEKRFREAMNILIPWMEEDGDGSRTRLFLHAALAAGIPEKEILGRARAFTRNGGHASDWQFLAQVEHLAGNPGRAALAMETALGMGPSEPDGWVQVARLYAREGLFASAARSLQNAGSGWEQERVGYLLAAGIYGEALDLLEKTGGTEAGMLEVRIRIQQGDPRAALARLNRMEENPEVHYARGLCYWELGEYEKAGLYFSRLLENPAWKEAVQGLSDRMKRLESNP